jgi:hypothetical protein
MVCGMELRKWIVENNCVSMCTNNKCFLCGIVSKDIVNINNFKINTKLREKINKMDKKDVKEERNKEMFEKDKKYRFEKYLELKKEFENG